MTLNLQFINASIARRLIFPVPIVTVVAIAIAWLVLPSYILRNTVADAVAEAQRTVGQFKTLRGYYTEFVAAKALKSGALKPSIDHRGKDNEIPLPATMIHDLSETLAAQGTTFKLYSAYPFPNRQGRQLDEFAQSAWDFLVANPDGVFSRRDVIKGQDVVRVAVADRMATQACIACHNTRNDSPKKDWKLNDVRGVLEVVREIDGALVRGGRMTDTIMVAIALFGGFLSLVCALVARQVSRPVRALTNSMRRLADGDHDVAIGSGERRDEIGAMSKAVQVFKDNAIAMVKLKSEQETLTTRAEHEKKTAMNRMADAFEAGVRAVVDAVATTAGQMRISAQTMSTTAEETSRQSTAVAAASEEASTNVQTVASASEELSASITEISRQVTQSAKIAGHAVEEANLTNQSVQSLAESAQKIGDVVKLISDIAGQTNLLALNATIEAARAGEAGKGFAVVASEVKSLATQTARATEDIGAQIGAIQAATHASVQAIAGIGKTIGEIHEIATTIASAVEEQGAATQEIARNVQQAAKGTGEVSANIAGVTQAAGETGQAAGQVLSASAGLAQQAERLRTQVDKFIAEIRVA